jgi:hypothetical protein
MKTFEFKLFIRTAQGQQFQVGKKIIKAHTYNMASREFDRLDNIPFCNLVEIIEIN